MAVVVALALALGLALACVWLWHFDFPLIFIFILFDTVLCVFTSCNTFVHMVSCVLLCACSVFLCS